MLRPGPGPADFKLGFEYAEYAPLCFSRGDHVLATETMGEVWLGVREAVQDGWPSKLGYFFASQVQVCAEQ